MPSPRRISAILLALLLSACHQPPAADVGVGEVIQTRGDSRGGAVSDAEVVAADPYAAATDRSAIDWRPLALEAGQAWLSCDHDYANGEGTALRSPDYTQIRAALEPCGAGGLLRLRYQGKISDEFTALIERTVEVADTLGIHKRILDIDSTGGQIEEAIRSGDMIGASRWTIWVREGAVCHSSCVLVLAAGDMRMIAGKVGIHRMIRISSKATSRAELQEELQAVHADVREYLQRNGVAFAIADLMMTVPNRSLRLLTAQEMDLYGLEGRNAAEDDLQRIELTRRCGADFVQRKDAFFRAFDRECQAAGDQVGSMGECGLKLRERFGFPDAQCPVQSPLSEFDSAVTVPLERRSDTSHS
ncbi:hypothetical protein INQ41_03845 [Lysobacter ciconiae]|uniref:Secreted protein n=1 Tax=Novilysobacter ciconiae TaxID=2781022 RepID=A0A7S6ZSS9_9GAMM|nr:hypothetical protein [Lysobacter ciconiae]QOW20177.1 hypothetical protein INQ41_03845 [Lysobacter ciconiae]